MADDKKNVTFGLLKDLHVLNAKNTKVTQVSS